MRTFLGIVFGLALGAAAALVLGFAVYSLVPAVPVPTAPATSAPAIIVPTPTPTLGPTATAALTSAPTVSGTPSPFPLVGQAAPALVATGLDGTPVDLSAYRGKPVWIVFTATDRAAARDQYPLMSGFATRYADAGLVVLAIDVKEDAATVRAFLGGLNVGFPIGLDEDGSLAATWDAAALPVHYWIGSDGIIRDAAAGTLDAAAMRRSLATILPGVTIGE